LPMGKGPKVNVRRPLVAQPPPRHHDYKTEWQIPRMRGI
jgi:hypothetical protein